jgi:hypothetical protein
LLKSELLKAIQSEINRHGLDTFPCEWTTAINNNVLPPLLDRLSKSENAEPPDEDSIDRLLGRPGAEAQAEVGGAGRDLGGDRRVFEG